MSTLDELRLSLDRQHRACERDGFPSTGVRGDRLERLASLLKENKSTLCGAMQMDYFCRPISQSLLDIDASLSSLKYTHDQMLIWLDHKHFYMKVMPAFKRQPVVRHQPKGVVGVIAAWSFPLEFLWGSVGAIFSAGNRCIVHLPKEMPATSMLIHQLIGQYFDAEELLAVTEEAINEEQFSSLSFDHILFAGEAAVGKVVMRSAANNLTPVTCVPGAKSPVIIGKNANIRKVAKSIVSKKMNNAGQRSDAPDYVFVRDGWLNDFIAEVERAFQESYPFIAGNPDYCSMINKYHYQRIAAYLDDVRDHGGEVWNVVRSHEVGTRLRDSRKIPLTLVINPSDTMRLMREEILGPLLPVKGYGHIDDAIEYVASHPRPFALYYYGRDKSGLERVLSQTSSATAIVNDALHGVESHQAVIDNFKVFSHSQLICR